MSRLAGHPFPAILALLAACADEPPQTSEAARFGMAEHALVLVLDGARIEESFGDEESWGGGESDALPGATAQILPLSRTLLLPEGALAKPGYVVGTTMTVPAHADLLQGTHRTFANLPQQEGAAYYRPHLPTLFELLRAQRELSAEQVRLVGNTELLQALDWSLYPGLGQDFAASYDWVTSERDPSVSADSDLPVLQRVRELLDDDARFVLANLHHIDLTGHNEPESYAATIAEIDAHLLQLWQWIQGEDSDLADRTLFVVLSDHGRHRFYGGYTPWQDHGCQCSGCREVPIFLAGPGVERNLELGGPHVLEDISATLAWLLGVDLPFGSGLVMTDALQGDPQLTQPSGPTRLHSSGELLAWQDWTGQLASRNSLVLDGERIEDSGALLLEQPRVLHGAAQDFACWRRLAVGGDEEYWNWQARCAWRDKAGWQEIGFPEEALPHDFAPALAADSQGRLHLLFPDILTEWGDGRSIAEDGVLRLLRWSQEVGWTMPETSSEHGYGPAHPALAFLGDTAWAAWAACDSIEDCRYTRHIELLAVDWPADEAEPSWGEPLRIEGPDSQGRSYGRLEAPALCTVAERLHLALLGFSDEGVSVLWTAGSDKGWSALRALSPGGEVYPHVSPVWSAEGILFWAQRGSDGLAEVCRLAAGDTAGDCVSAGHPYLESLAPVGEELWASVSDGGGQWVLEQVR